MPCSEIVSKTVIKNVLNELFALLAKRGDVTEENQKIINFFNGCSHISHSSLLLQNSVNS